MGNYVPYSFFMYLIFIKIIGRIQFKTNSSHGRKQIGSKSKKKEEEKGESKIENELMMWLHFTYQLFENRSKIHFSLAF